MGGNTDNYQLQQEQVYYLLLFYFNILDVFTILNLMMGFPFSLHILPTFSSVKCALHPSIKESNITASIFNYDVNT